jgi:methionine aminotransferase
MKSKLPNVGTTIFTTMSKMAHDYGAINLSQGFPNFPVDPKLTAILERKSLENVHQYAPMEGNISLLENVGQLIHKSYNRSNNPSTELLICAGATEAIFATIQALVSQGEEVIVFDPSYDCYVPPVVLSGAKAIRIPMTEQLKPDWNVLKDCITEKTRMIIVNNPHNPSGRVLDEEDFLILEDILQNRSDIVLLSDEVYEFITFEKKHLSVNGREKLRNQSVIVSSFGKTFHITGWKIGYLIAPEYLVKEIKKVHQFLVFSVNSVAQAALSSYLEHVNVNELGPFYRKKRDHFKKLMERSKFELLESEGTYFQLAKYCEISNEPDVDFCERLVKEFGVAAIPLSVFNADGKDLKLIRFCFAKDNITLEQAAEKLCKI